MVAATRSRPRPPASTGCGDNRRNQSRPDDRANVRRDFCRHVRGDVGRHQAGGATATQGAATPGSGDGTTLTLIAKNTLWDKSELKAKPGTVTFQMDNQDDGIPHNIHVYKGKDNTGQDMGMTELEAGPVKQTLTLELTAGEYFFVCDVHPATMAGKLEVE